MTKLYYKTPEDAFYMWQKFVVKFEEEFWLDVSIPTLNPFNVVDAPKGNIYIHPDSYEIFEPKIFDRGIDKNQNDYWCNSEGKWERFFTELDLEDCRQERPAFNKNWNVESIKTTYRNGLSFIMPEREE